MMIPSLGKIFDAAKPTKVEFEIYNKVKLHYKCPVCGAETVLTLPHDEYTKFLEGMKIYNVFPNLDGIDGKTIVTGKCRACLTKGSN